MTERAVGSNHEGHNTMSATTALSFTGACSAAILLTYLAHAGVEWPPSDDALTWGPQTNGASAGAAVIAGPTRPIGVAPVWVALRLPAETNILSSAGHDPGELAKGFTGVYFRGPTDFIGALELRDEKCRKNQRTSLCYESNHGWSRGCPRNRNTAWVTKR